jgi:hypothetical protein
MLIDCKLCPKIKFKLKERAIMFFGHSAHATANTYQYYITLVSKMLAMITESLGSIHTPPRQIL